MRIKIVENKANRMLKEDVKKMQKRKGRK